jgi:UDPglucose 6-dehydrogenase
MKRLSFFTHKYALLTLLISYHSCKPVEIAIIGTGYVGLVTGAGLAQLGNNVVCGDINEKTIEKLNKNIMPIYEPGLAEVVQDNVNEGRISFTTDCARAIRKAEVIFIAVPTPMAEDGSANLRYVENVVDTIAENLNTKKFIVTKSTVPTGTNRGIKSLLLNKYNIDPDLFEVISNPEFLREGSAVEDFLQPDRVVIGIESQHAKQKMNNVYQGFIDQGVPIIFSNLETAELAKYAANAFLSVKLSFVNEIANMCDATGANYEELKAVLGTDHRISNNFLNPGPGYGGSCFPKDTQALTFMAKEKNVAVNTVHAAIDTNTQQKLITLHKLLPLLNNDLQDKTIALFGLAFKGNTDDIRYSPAINFIEQLQEYGANINAYDPEAMQNMQKEYDHFDINYFYSWQEATENADALVIMTEWPQFANIDLVLLKKIMTQPIVVDARNMLAPQELTQNGFIHDNIGMSCLAQYSLETN